MGRPFSVLFTEVGNIVNRSDSASQTKIKEGINRWYRKVIKSKNWAALKATTSISLAAGAQEFALPQEVDRVLRIYDLSNDVVISLMEDAELIRRNVATLDSNKSAYAASHLGEMGVKLQPASASTITISSSSTSDTMTDVRITGFNSDVPAQETLTLNGTTNVTTTAQFTEVRTVVKKELTVGSVTVTDGGNTLSQIGARRYSATYKWLRLSGILPSAATLNITYMIRPPDLEDDVDQMWIECEDVVIYGAYSDFLRSIRQFGQAREAERLALDALDNLMSEEMANDTDYSFAVETGRS